MHVLILVFVSSSQRNKAGSWVLDYTTKKAIYKLLQMNKQELYYLFDLTHPNFAS